MYHQGLLVCCVHIYVRDRNCPRVKIHLPLFFVHLMTLSMILSILSCLLDRRESPFDWVCGLSSHCVYRLGVGKCLKHESYTHRQRTNSGREWTENYSDGKKGRTEDKELFRQKPFGRKGPVSLSRPHDKEEPVCRVSPSPRLKGPSCPTRIHVCRSPCSVGSNCTKKRIYNKYFSIVRYLIFWSLGL